MDKPETIRIDRPDRQNEQPSGWIDEKTSKWTTQAERINSSKTCEVDKE